jgi:LuxR family transcriptional regulator, maltose regulon positive regulatory protein
MKTFHAKITGPKLRNIVVRERLFAILDEMATHHVTWVSSQAGSGKTVLLATYLKESRIPFLWYRVDEEDGDPAGFFDYMSEAAKGPKRRRNKPLPLFTPECRSGMFAFTRYYFESLFGRLATPYAIVLDNYQDAPEPSQFHEAMRNGFGLMLEGIRVFVASRNDCPRLSSPLRSAAPSLPSDGKTSALLLKR